MTTTTVDTIAISAGSGGTSTPVKLTLQTDSSIVCAQVKITTTRATSPGVIDAKRKQVTICWAFSPENLTLSTVPDALRHCTKTQSHVINADLPIQRFQIRDKVAGQYCYFWLEYPAVVDSYSVVVTTTELSFSSSSSGAGNLVPSSDDLYTVGSATFRYAQGFFSQSVRIGSGTTGPTILSGGSTANDLTLGGTNNTTLTIGSADRQVSISLAGVGGYYFGTSEFKTNGGFAPNIGSTTVPFGSLFLNGTARFGNGTSGPNIQAVGAAPNEQLAFTAGAGAGANVFAFFSLSSGFNGGTGISLYQGLGYRFISVSDSNNPNAGIGLKHTSDTQFDWDFITRVPGVTAVAPIKVGTTAFSIVPGGLLLPSTQTVKFGATSAITIGSSADSSSGELEFSNPNTGYAYNFKTNGGTSRFRIHNNGTISMLASGGFTTGGSTTVGTSLIATNAPASSGLGVYANVAGQYDFITLANDDTTVTNTFAINSYQYNGTTRRIMNRLIFGATSLTNTAEAGYIALSTMSAGTLTEQLRITPNLVNLFTTGTLRFGTANSDVQIRKDSNQTLGVVLGDGASYANMRVGGVNYSGTLTGLSGGQILTTSTKSASYTITSSDQVITFSGSTAAQSLTLPAVSGTTGRIYQIKNRASVTVNVVTTASANEIFTTVATNSITLAVGDSAQFISDGSFWTKL